MTPQQTFAAIRSVITRLIEAGLSDEQKYPSIKKTGKKSYEIGIEGAPDLSASLKDAPYDEIYLALAKAGAFNVKMVDGALIQLAYTFEANEIASHRLAFFPAPNLEAYEDARSLYDDDEIFADIVSKYLVRFPVRFDFSCADKLHVEVDHPKSHLSLGQYKNCRIPVNGPVTPARFASFIIRNFYFSTFPQVKLGTKADRLAFTETISKSERGVAHLIT